jgi:hypothetical protein
MRLSEWRKRAPSRDSVSPKVQAVVDPALGMLGAPGDPDCWVVWGDDPGVRYMILAPTQSGLVQLNVRVNVAGEGPRASGKVVRWNRVQLGELGLEMQGGHRLISFQVETQVLNGADAMADAIAGFAQVLFAAVDGRPAPATSGTPPRRAAIGPGRSASGKGGRAAAAAATAPAATARPKAPAAKAPKPTASATKSAAPKAVVPTKPPAVASTSRRSPSKGT